MSGGRQKTLTPVCPRGGWFSREADRKSRIRGTNCDATMVVSELMVAKPRFVDVSIARKEAITVICRCLH